MSNIAGYSFEPIYAIADNDKNLISMVYLCSSEVRCNCVAQNCGISSVQFDYYNFHTKGIKYDRKLVRKHGGYKTWYKGVVIADTVGKEFLFTTEDAWKRDLFDRLMIEHHFPMLPEWADYIGEQCKYYGFVRFQERYKVMSRSTYSFANNTEVFGTDGITFSNLRVLKVSVTADNLKQMIIKGIQDKKIKVADEAMEKLGISELDDYIIRFNESIGENLKKTTIFPKAGSIRKKSVEGLALKTKKLHAPQADNVNGVVAAMQAHDKYVFMACDMGTGKTLMSASAVEAYYNQKWLKQHPGKTLKDCFESKEVAYRGAIMCPSHMCEKWKREIEKEIPYAKAHIVTSLSQLAALRKNPKRKGKEFFIFSKEIAKNDTLKRPVPKHIGYKQPIINICADCLEADLNFHNEEHRKIKAQKEPFTFYQLSGLRVSPVKMEGGHPTCVRCGSKRTRKLALNFWHMVGGEEDIKEGRETTLWEGLNCPNCDGLLLKYSSALAYNKVTGEDFPDYILTAADFASKKQENECCQLCGTALWEDNVENMHIPLHGKPTKIVPKDDGKKRSWRKIKCFANYAKKKANKMDKSGFALTGFERAFVTKNGVDQEWVESARTAGPRRYSLARYCKKYLKGAFDVVIADEAHLYEGIKTEQSIALHDLMRCAKFTMLLTGTLTNGTASSLFSIHWMCNPAKMLQLGYQYNSKSLETFNSTYGVTETRYEYDGGGMNAQGRGRQIGTSRVRPGISPMIYPDLLLDHSVMLNITDMSNHLPPLNEYVEEIEMPSDISNGYYELMNKIKDALVNPPLGAGLIGKMLNVGLSYPDKPYEREDIWSLKVDDYLICKPDNLVRYKNELTPKEKHLVEIVNKELSENRNIFVYTEYSRKEESCVDERLQEILETHCGLKGSVAVIKSGEISATEREEYIQKMSDKIKVFITNYRNVETGMDFVGEYEGRRYNYPTLIFYQIGCSLSSVWQASRRHYRLNQTRECRTYYLVYKNCYQLDILQMMAKKISAAGAIQGNFSASALENMSGGVEDPTVALAKKLVQGDMGGHIDIDLADTFRQQKELAIQCCSSEEEHYIGPDAVTFYDVMGNDYEEPYDLFEEDEDEEDLSGLTLISSIAEDMATVVKKEEKTKEEPDISDAMLEDAFAFIFETQQAIMVSADVVKKSNKKAKVCAGQFSLF